MTEEHEYPIGLSENVWINNMQVTPGTFHRIKEVIDENNQPISMSLVRLDTKEVPISLDEETVYLELRLYEEIDPLERVPSQDLVEYLKERYKPKKLRVESSQTGLREATKAPLMGSDCLLYVSGFDLRANSVASIDIQIDGHKNSYPTSVIEGIFKDPHRDRLLINWFDPEGEVFNSTYKLSKIIQTRKTAPKNPAVIKAEEILARKRLS